MKTIYFDMDNTIADLYNVADWANKLDNKDVTPYIEAKPMVKESTLLKIVARGFNVGIISWLAKNCTDKNYDKAVRCAKRAWLKKQYPNVAFNEIHIVKYGTNKYSVAKDKNSILIDDNENVRNKWKSLSLPPASIYDLT